LGQRGGSHQNRGRWTNAFLIARDIKQYARLVWVFIVEQAGHVLVFLYLLGAGIQTLAQAGPPLIIAAIFLVLLVLFRR